MARLFGIIVAISLTFIFAYLSRFWVFAWWGREGLFGIEALLRGGDLWRRWMNDLDLGTYDIVLWIVAVFIALTLLQKLWDRIGSGH